MSFILGLMTGVAATQVVEFLCSESMIERENRLRRESKQIEELDNLRRIQTEMCKDPANGYKLICSEIITLDDIKN